MKDQKINISFDVEDIYGDQKLLNNTLFDLLNFCEENKIYVDVYISAIKIPYLSPDIINLLQNRVIFLMITSDDRKWYHYVCPDIYNYSKNILEFHINISEQESNYIKFLKYFETLN